MAFETIRVKGMKKVLGNLSKISKDTPRRAERAMFILTSKAAEATRVKMQGWIWDKGDLASGIDNMVKWEKGALSGYVFTDKEYGIWVHFGTGIYGPKGTPIRPKHAKVLRFEVKGGKVVYAKSVKGMRPRPFMNVALQYLAEHAEEEFKRMMR